MPSCLVVSEVQTARARGTHRSPADFEDGYRAAEVCDAIVHSAQHGTREAVTYRAGRVMVAEPG
ncbi:MAG: hypothetical protein QOG70_2426 [Solirubrobacteraceae bacterium]|jgi:predicted dehydrogenase|nr:hypothetical protein [Solirubrobacteraceae bacterium]